MCAALEMKPTDSSVEHTKAEKAQHRDGVEVLLQWESQPFRTVKAAQDLLTLALL